MADPKKRLTLPPSGQPITTIEIGGRTYRLVPEKRYQDMLDEMVKRLNNHETRIAALEP